MGDKMKRKSLQPLLPDLITKLSKIPKLTTAVLYGSAARGELTERSDIDLLLVFDVPHNPETGGELEAAHRALGELKIERRAQLVATNVRAALDPDFLDNICREGVVIYGKPLVLTAEKLQLRPRVIFVYTVAGLPQIKKSQVQRALKGYRVVKRIGGKKYVSEKEGLLDKLGGEKIGKGALMVPQENSQAFESLFKLHGVKYQKMKVWS